MNCECEKDQMHLASYRHKRMLFAVVECGLVWVFVLCRSSGPVLSPDWTVPVTLWYMWEGINLSDSPVWKLVPEDLFIRTLWSAVTVPAQTVYLTFNPQSQATFRVLLPGILQHSENGILGADSSPLALLVLTALGHDLCRTVELVLHDADSNQELIIWVYVQGGRDGNIFDEVFLHNPPSLISNPHCFHSSLSECVFYWRSEGF